MKRQSWENILKGNKDDYSDAYIFYYKRLYNYGRKFTEDIILIEDSINEIFISIWFNKQNLHHVQSPQSYIFTSFRNKILQKKRSIKLSEFKEEKNDEMQFPIDSFIIQKERDSELKYKIDKAIQKLTHRQREVIFLRFYENLSYPEIAGIMNITIKATYKLMARALEQMRNVLSFSLTFYLMVLKVFLNTSVV